MGKRTREALIARGFDSQLASKLDESGNTLTFLQGSSDDTLKGLGLNERQVVALREGGRPPIPQDVLLRVLYDSHWVCVVCHEPTAPVVVHHIEPWESSHDHSEDNLAALCLHHHDEAHTRHELSLNLSVDRLRDAKARWIAEVARENADVARAAPATDLFHVEVDADCTLDANGYVIARGTTNLPDDTSLMFTMTRLDSPRLCGQSKTKVVDGRFASSPLGAEGGAPAPGRYKVEILAYFNGAWQSERIRSVTGFKGEKLRGPSVKPKPDDVIDPDYVVSHFVPAIVPGDDVTTAEIALEIVRDAKVPVPGREISSETVAGGALAPASQ